jgi:hypothetical protein
MKKYWGSFIIKYKDNLECFAQFLEQNVFYGTIFEQSDIYDEVPAVVSKKTLLGFKIIISESTKANWYIVEIQGEKYCSEDEKDEKTKVVEHEFNHYLKELFEKEGLDVKFTRKDTRES